MGMKRRAAERVRNTQSEIHDEPNLDHTGSGTAAKSRVRRFRLRDWSNLIDEVRG